jgi:hypothetical protein
MVESRWLQCLTAISQTGNTGRLCMFTSPTLNLNHSIVSKNTLTCTQINSARLDSVDEDTDLGVYGTERQLDLDHQQSTISHVPCDQGLYLGPCQSMVKLACESHEKQGHQLLQEEQENPFVLRITQA